MGISYNTDQSQGEIWGCSELTTELETNTFSTSAQMTTMLLVAV